MTIVGHADGLEYTLKFRDLVELSPDAIVVVNHGGHILFVNTQAEHMFGYTREEILGQPVERLMPHRTGEVHVSLRSAYFRNPHTRPMGVGRDLFARRKDGTEFPVEISLSPLTTDAGTVVYSSVRDITERKRLEMALVQAQKLETVGQLAGGIAHDFNNLLTAILGYVEMMLEQIEEDKPIWPDLQEILKAGNSAAALTHQLLAFSRRQVLQPQPTNLNTILQRVEVLLRRTIREDIALVLHLAPDLTAVKVDPTQLQQVIMNLVVNARDAMPKGGTITIATSNVVLDDAFARAHPPTIAGRYVQLTVRDTGSGMDPQTRAHLFEPFFTTKEQGKGTGLGLATVYGIVNQSGGYIWVDSEPGQGTRFAISFPQIDEPAQEHPAASPHLDVSLIGHRETILVVEDNAAVRELALRILARHGYRVVGAASAEEAVATVEQLDRPLDLVLTDVILGAMNGRDLATALRTRQPQLAVIFMSGYARNLLTAEGRQEPTFELLEKPFHKDDLLRKVREQLDRRE